jgi:hypothetical protein
MTDVRQVAIPRGPSLVLTRTGHPRQPKRASAWIPAPAMAYLRR